MLGKVKNKWCKLQNAKFLTEHDITKVLRNRAGLLQPNRLRARMMYIASLEKSCLTCP